MRVWCLAAMSSESTTVEPRHFEYLAVRTRLDDRFTSTLKAAAVAAGIPRIWIAAEQASFLQVLLASARAREVVEVGTLCGVAAIAMARALPRDGRVRTIEIDAGNAAFAREWIAKSDVAERIEVHEGDARDVLAGFADASADAMFIDADKSGYAQYLDHALRIVRPGGLVLADNALAFGKLLDEVADDDPDAESVAAIRAFNDRIAARADLHSVLVPIGDGMWVGVRRDTDESAPVRA